MLAVVLLAASCTGDTPGTAEITPTGAVSPQTSSTTTTDPATTVEADPPGDETATPAVSSPPSELEIVAYPVPAGSRPDDVAPAVDGGVWYTAQGSGELGWLDPITGETSHIGLGAGSRPHGVIVDDAGTPWITDGGLNAVVAVDPATDEITVHPLPADRRDANLNTATFDAEGHLWFTGQNGTPTATSRCSNRQPRSRGAASVVGLGRHTRGE